jgi:tetratricopeptide (TPR) repeat protein
VETPVRAALIGVVVLLLGPGRTGAEPAGADALFAARRYREAAAAYRAAAPDDVEARYRRGVALAAAGELADAADAWQEVLALAPDHARARRNLELLRVRLPSPDAADPVLALPYARALAAQGRAASARAVLDRLRDPAAAAEALALRGELDLALGDPAGAVDDLGRLLLLTPRSPRAYHGLAAAWRAAGAADRAAYFTRAAADTR